jgi:hypothetical protein
MSCLASTDEESLLIATPSAFYKCRCGADAARRMEQRSFTPRPLIDGPNHTATLTTSTSANKPPKENSRQQFEAGGSVA